MGARYISSTMFLEILQHLGPLDLQRRGRCPEVSVKSDETIRKDLMASAWETDWLAFSMAAWTAALMLVFSRRLRP